MPDRQEPAPQVEHQCTDVWEIGYYLCSCGEPWLNERQICMTQRTDEWEAAYQARRRARS